MGAEETTPTMLFLIYERSPRARDVEVNRDVFDSAGWLQEDLSIHDVTINKLRGRCGAVEDHSVIGETEVGLHVSQEGLNLCLESLPCLVDVWIEQEAGSNLRDALLNEDHQAAGVNAVQSGRRNLQGLLTEDYNALVRELSNWVNVSSVEIITAWDRDWETKNRIA